MTDTIETDVLVIGSGIAGCVAALTMAESGLDVILLSAGAQLDDGNTALAQGGIVYQGVDDTPEEMARDIFTAGWELNYPRAVRFLCRRGPEVLRSLFLEKLALPFAREGNGDFHLTREGGHGRARILHSADYTGRVIMDGLLDAIRSCSNIRVMTGMTAIDLLTTHHHSKALEIRYQITNQCVGAYVLENSTGEVRRFLADYTVLATGGIGQVYLNTTNSPASLGSGLAMAHRAGAVLRNLEYIQFHPTALFHRGPRRFLISEAVRGEGAKLINNRGHAFMTDYDPRADLAPRDIVTRAIVDEMLKTGEDFVYLDAAKYCDQDLAERFPTIYQKCLELGVDMTKQPIPVVPAAHYFCGGILVDLRGRTTIERLSAGGECTCTGVHGANRLASTSLLEGLLWGHAIGQDITARVKRCTQISRKLKASIPGWKLLGDRRNEDPVLISQDWATIKHTMWNYVGIKRTTPRLRRAFDDLRDLDKRLHSFYKETLISKSLVDLFHGCLTAYIITTAAMRNTQSKGCHFRVDA
ncbi:MAG TPA: L-aspartate oxidase [Desulfonatronum sp.]|nr:L-aspartate oxidase [Desulfonatronum sp.]